EPLIAAASAATVNASFRCRFRARGSPDMKMAAQGRHHQIRKSDRLFSGLSCCCLFGGLGSSLLGGERLCCSDLLGLDASLLGSDCLTLFIVQLAGANAGVLGNTSRLTATITQVVELGAANLAAADDFNGLHQRGVDREHALHAFAVGDLADG